MVSAEPAIRKLLPTQKTHFICCIQAIHEADRIDGNILINLMKIRQLSLRIDWQHHLAMFYDVNTDLNYFNFAY